MPGNKETVVVHANIEITSQTIKNLVAAAKQLNSRNEKGHHQIDTADLLCEMISRFLAEKNFEEFVRHAENYKK